jgi:hypothetical protein
MILASVFPAFELAHIIHKQCTHELLAVFPPFLQVPSFTHTHTYLDRPADGPASAEGVIDNERDPMLLGQGFEFRKAGDVVLLV